MGRASASKPAGAFHLEQGRPCKGARRTQWRFRKSPICALPWWELAKEELKIARFNHNPGRAR